MNPKDRIVTADFIRLFLFSVAACTGMNMLNVIISLFVTQTLRETAGLAGWMTTVYTISACVSRPVNGVLTDRLGRRRVMCGGMLLFSVSCLLVGLVPSVAVLAVCRVLMGVSYSAATTANNTASTDVIPASRLAEGVGYFGMSQSVASAFGPALAAVAATGLGNQNALLTVAAIGGGAFLLGQTIRYEASRPAAPKAREKTSVLERTALLPALFQGISLFLISCLMCFMTLYIVSLGFPSTVAGAFFTVASVLLIAVRLFGSHLMNRFSVVAFLVPGYLVLTAACVLLPFAQSVPMLLGIGVLYGASYGTIWMALGSEAVRLAPAERRGAANATFYFAFDAAIGLGAAFWGTMIDRIGYVHCFRGIALSSVILAAVCVPVFLRRSCKL